jgi:outer membrane receptor protein involved in Fe transport
MRKLKLRLIAATSAIAIIVASPQARAADAASSGDANPAGSAPSSAGIDDIVVTAERRQESVNTVPLSINAVSADQLRNENITSVADLQKIVPGFHFSEGTYAAPVYAIRGIGFNESSLGAKPDVSLSQDEVPLPFPIMSAGVGLDLARVEVLKGPQGTLYGQNATGGAINYISAKPGTSFEAGADLSYGRFNDVNATAFVSGPINDVLAARFALGTEQSDGWQKSVTRGDTLGAKHKTEGRFLLDWHPSDRFKAELSLNADIDRSDTQAAQYIALTSLGGTAAVAKYVPLLLTYPVAPKNDQAADWVANAPLHNNNPFYQAALHAEYALTDSVTLTSISSYAKYFEDRWQSADGTSYQNELYHTLGKIDVATQELRLSGNAGDAHWIFGGNYEYDQTSQQDNGYVDYDTNAYALAPFGLPFYTYYNLSRETFKTEAVFASVDYSLTDDLIAHGAIRYTRADISYNGCTGDGGDGALSLDFSNFGNYLRSFAGLPPLPAPATGACVTLNNNYAPGLASSTLNETNLPWRVGMDWTPREGTMLYANVSKGYKSGSYPILSASVDSQVEPVRQESVLAYEAGVKLAAIENVLQVNAAGFYYDYTDKQLRGRIVVPVFGALETLVNVPKSSVYGAETDITWKPIAGLSTTLGATLVQSQILDGFTNYNPFGVLQNFNHESFPLTPKWQGFVDGQYDWSLGGGLMAFAGANYAYQSETNGGLGEQAILKIAPYGLLDNVTNKYYWTNADHIADTSVRFTGMPATYGLSISYRY